MPFVFSKWLSEWAAYALGRWTFLEVLDHVSRLSILVALVFYLAEAPDRRKQMHYQAWQVINTSQGKGGSGGRIEALHELNEDRVPLVGVDVSNAFLQGVRLPSADLRRSDFDGADLLGADLTAANLRDSSLRSTNLRNAKLPRADLRGARLRGADLHGADLGGANLAGCDLSGVDLGEADLAGAKWEGLALVRDADLAGARNAPAGFLEWATRNGAKPAAGAGRPAGAAPTPAPPAP